MIDNKEKKINTFERFLKNKSLVSKHESNLLSFVNI
jgi:hypothetical protein